jgi:hypothetical protein
VLNGMSQNQFVLNHLIDHGYITEVVARNYGIRRLASRIHDLSDPINGGGITIPRETRSDDAGVPYTYYTIADDHRAMEKASRERGGTWRNFIGEGVSRAAA